jgi:hypothetical protein
VRVRIRGAGSVLGLLGGDLALLRGQFARNGELGFDALAQSLDLGIGLEVLAAEHALHVAGDVFDHRIGSGFEVVGCTHG